MKNLSFAAIILVVTLLIFAVTVPALAQDRSTPVTVQNPVDIDPENNTVKAQQSGTWNTTVSGSVSVSNTPSVSVTNTPSVLIANTPGVSISNVPTVAISSTGNTVTTASSHSFIRPWTTDTSITNSNSLSSSIIDCAGFTEIRVVLSATISANPQSVQVRIGFKSGDGAYQSLGYGNFATPQVSVTPHANFIHYGGLCYISHPVLSDKCMITIANYSGNTITLKNHSWIYLVN